MPRYRGSSFNVEVPVMAGDKGTPTDALPKVWIWPETLKFCKGKTSKVDAYYDRPDEEAVAYVPEDVLAELRREREQAGKSWTATIKQKNARIAELERTAEALQSQLAAQAAKYKEQEDNWHEAVMRHAEKSNKADERIEELTKALTVAADQLLGMVLCFKTHGTNLNLGYLIPHLEKHVDKARAVLSEGKL